MIATILRSAAVLACLVILTSFSLFAIDQAGGASQQAQVEAGSHVAAQTDASGQTIGQALRGGGAETGVRATIDDLDRALLTPVQPLASGAANSWGARTIELAGGLVLYGLVLGMLARSTDLARRRRVHAAGAQPHF
ncbi:MAG TPA: hypothetical protein VFR49_14440 [Solirubrobacteraceae bacterium]|nr:hypothetical protein [Solirubrobacteraceae bacterium]